MNVGGGRLRTSSSQVAEIDYWLMHAVRVKYVAPFGTGRDEWQVIRWVSADGKSRDIAVHEAVR